MTDRIDTNQDLVATLAQITESINVNTPSLDAIEAQLVPLLDAAEARGDNQAVTLITATYARAQELLIVATHNREAALTMKDIAETFQSQRDETLKELEDLTEAIEFVNTNNSLVSDLVEAVHEAIDEEDSYWYPERVEETIFEQLQDVFHYDDQYEKHINIFLDIWRVSLKVSPARKREFFAWLDAVKADSEVSDDDE
jgi:hypothetical protein